MQNEAWPHHRMPHVGEVHGFRETQLKAKHYTDSDPIPRGPCDVDDLLETVTIKRVWDGQNWARVSDAQNRT